VAVEASAKPTMPPIEKPVAPFLVFTLFFDVILP
jgi:hypothetical protein